MLKIQIELVSLQQHIFINNFITTIQESTVDSKPPINSTHLHNTRLISHDEIPPLVLESTSNVDPLTFVAKLNRLLK